MRVACCLLMALAACSGNDGAVLTFETPEGEVTASRIELVLAAADAVSTIDGQRIRATHLGQESVLYYRQRATGGAIDGVGTVAGFVVRIEPDADVAPDEAFIPFALLYDASGALTGIGTVYDEAGEPMAVMIRSGTSANYQLVVSTVAQVDAASDERLDEGAARAVTCYAPDQTPWPSGVAWRLATGPQRRLLFPDVSVTPDATDASARPKDLDCDTFQAGEGDCDDLRLAFNPGVTDLCDGYDSDCDGKLIEVIEGCNLAGATCATGGSVAYCTDTFRNGIPPAAPVCQEDAACACANGTNACNRCTIDFIRALAPGMDLSLCAPAVGKLHVADSGCTPNAPCTVSVASVTGPFEVKLSGSLMAFTNNTMIDSQDLYLRVQHLPGPATSSLPGARVGQAFLAVTRSGGQVDPLPVTLELDDDGGNECAPSQLPDAAAGLVWMTCAP